MGTWNTEILGNDSAMDVYAFFEKLYNKQSIPIDQIKQKTLAEFGLVNEKNEPIYGNHEWLAYAYICWECKVIDNNTLQTVANILNDKDNIKEEWEGLAFERINKIEQFYAKIQTPPKRKKQIKKEHIVNVPFQVGDCILSKSKNGKYSVVILLDIDKKKNTENMWTYYLGTTRVFQDTKPTKEDILNSHFLVLNYGENLEGKKARWIEKPDLWIQGRFIGTVKNEKEKTEKEIKLNEYEILTNLKLETLPELGKSFGRMHLDNSFQLESQTNWEKNNPSSIDLSYPIKSYVSYPNLQSETKKKNKWQFWK